MRPLRSGAVIDFLVPRGNARVVTFGGIFLTSGTVLWWPLFAIFLASNGLAPVLIGAVFALGTLVAIITAPLGGLLADRYSRSGVLIAGAAVNAAGLLFIALTSYETLATFPVLVGLFGVVSLGGNLGGGALRALLFESARPEQRGAAMASPYVLPSFVAIPMPFVGSVLSQVTSWSLVFLLAGALVSVTCAIYAAFLVEAPRDPQPVARSAARPARKWFRWGTLPFPVIALIGVYALVGFAQGIAVPFIPLYFTVFLGSTVSFFGVLASLELATIGVLALVSGKLVDRLGSLRTIFVSLAAESVVAAAMVFVRNLLLAGAFFVAWGAADWLDLTAPSVFIGSHVKRQNRATTLASFSMATQLPRLIAPGVGGLLFAAYPPSILVSYAALVGVSAFVALVLGGWRGREPEPPGEPPPGIGESATTS